MKIYMQSVKYDLITKMTEYYSEFAFSNILNMLGISCETETHSAAGSVDSVIKFKKNVFVIEMKVDKPIEEAMKQIEEKKYYVPYLGQGNRVFKIGVVFGEKERNVIDWRCDECL
jgi:hypothetical protein